MSERPAGRVDAHQHFWDPATAHYPWMTDAVAPLCRRFGPDDLRPHLERNAIGSSVVVQARSDVAETRELLRIAAAEPFVAGVVGWFDLTDAAVGERIAEVRAEPEGRFLVGVRHQVEDEPDAEWLRRDDVRRGLRAVQEHDLVYDLLVRPRDLPAAIEVVRALPGLRFVVDHIAKPPIAREEPEPWGERLAALAAHENTWCKLSGIVNEAGAGWRTGQIAPYVERVVEMFGPERLLYGSDWPVSLLFGSYDDQLAALEETLPPLSAPERTAIMGTTAIALYELAPAGGAA